MPSESGAQPTAVSIDLLPGEQNGALIGPLRGEGPPGKITSTFYTLRRHHWHNQCRIQEIMGPGLKMAVPINVYIKLIFI